MIKPAMLSGPQKKFCDGIVSGKNASQAYRDAYPKSTAAAARASASELLTNPRIQAEIQRQRTKAEEKAGSSVLTLAEKRKFLAELVRAQPETLASDSNLWQSIKRTELGTEYRLPDKLKAIEIDSDLAGEGSEAEAQDALAGLLERVMK
jgi:phage terminase small subunit